ncbi:hypothetical protein PghCCS26_45940 [Paenibacillus glycanilyticus]|uniref:Uncharacterized protein n=1 Tax=Paenibacillus glycanilyticus TaxID=126569 RepID=A0ABQ6NSG5_9BACL|nr:hypothetical protein PghCCS26_45940 [Paenibacillus glycanilyticus]
MNINGGFSLALKDDFSFLLFVPFFYSMYKKIASLRKKSEPVTVSARLLSRKSQNKKE